MKEIKVRELRKRLLSTVLVLAFYMAGRSLLLYKIDPTAYGLQGANSQNIMVSMVSGDKNQYTLFALGVMPYITANLLIWIFTAAGGDELSSRFSPQSIERLTEGLMLGLAVLYAISRAEELIFLPSDLAPWMLKSIAVLEMTAGAAVVYKIAEFNRIYGIGAQMPVILVNICDNLYTTMRKFTWAELSTPLLMCLGMSAVILVMENIMLRIPVQRVSIHNSYADKSYLAFKLDIIGVMPVMFAVSVLMLPQMVIKALLFFDEENLVLQAAGDRLNLKDIVGVSAYLEIVFLLSILFAFLTLTPGKAARELQKGGDSIVGVYAGKKTKKYLRDRVLALSILNGLVLCIMMGTSLGMSLMGKIQAELAMLPASAMILTGMMCSLYWEVKSYWRFDSYSFFM